MQFRSKTPLGRIVELSFLPAVISAALISNAFGELVALEPNISKILEGFEPLKNLSIDTADFLFPFNKSEMVNFMYALYSYFAACLLSLVVSVMQESKVGFRQTNYPRLIAFFL